MSSLQQFASVYEFSLTGEVDDPEELYQAALARALAEGLEEQDAIESLRTDGEVDVTHCLIMLLDPGVIPGFKIHNSAAE